MSEDQPRGEKRANKLREEQRKDKVIRKSVLSDLLSTPFGRRFLWLELSAANVFAQTFVAGMPDATAFKEGQRSAGLRLLVEVTRVSPQGYTKMLAENNPEVAIEEEDENV